ncbi:hypothetical protein GGQ97_002522 [Sphingomonas kaistensis]|uniref:DUF4893 domain-containing protein n=1 Tax=Sphingomonas kaistensis TaxID=298708 RepID=A0A7X6BGR6_9SPHN|nr:hypothetical protein [Sphingomonas kaistensis]NJC06729.1 hypothetical protein [Sphingomonas kaistensis]
MRIHLLAATALAVAIPASAQQRQDDLLKSMGITIVEPMSAEQLARTRQAVAAEIARAGASGLFEDASDVNGGKARHLPSGLSCPLGKKGQRILYATATAAACETSGNGSLFRASVERAPADATLDWAEQYAQAAAVKEPGYKPWTGMLLTARPKRGSDAIEHRTLQFSSKASGRARNVRVQTGLVRGWLLTERSDSAANAQPNLMADMLSATTFGLAMRTR